MKKGLRRSWAPWSVGGGCVGGSRRFSGGCSGGLWARGCESLNPSKRKKQPGGVPACSWLVSSSLKTCLKSCLKVLDIAAMASASSMSKWVKTHTPGNVCEVWVPEEKLFFGPFATLLKQDTCTGDHDAHYHDVLNQYVRVMFAQGLRPARGKRATSESWPFGLSLRFEWEPALPELRGGRSETRREAEASAIARTSSLGRPRHSVYIYIYIYVL